MTSGGKMVTFSIFRHKGSSFYPLNLWCERNFVNEEGVTRGIFFENFGIVYKFFQVELSDAHL